MVVLLLPLLLIDTYATHRNPLHFIVNKLNLPLANSISPTRTELDRVCRVGLLEMGRAELKSNEQLNAQGS